MNSRLETKYYSGSSDQKHRFRMVRNWIEILLTNGPNEPIAEAFYVLYLSDDRKIEGKLDANGKLRKEDLPAGEVWVEFPDFFDLVVLEDSNPIEGPCCGSPPPLDLESVRPQSWGSSEPSPESDQDFEDENEDENEDEGEDEGERWLPAVMNDSEDLEEDEIVELPDVDFREPDTQGSEDNTKFQVAAVRCYTGQSYHLGVMRCISAHLFRRDGQPFPEPMKFEITDDDGDLVTEGECDDGIIFCDLVGVGDYELRIGGHVYWIPSKRDASDVERILLNDSSENGRQSEVQE